MFYPIYVLPQRPTPIDVPIVIAWKYAIAWDGMLLSGVGWIEQRESGTRVDKVFYNPAGNFSMV